MNPSLTPEQVQGLQAWTGRTDQLTDTATLAPARGLAATLDQAGEPHIDQAALPPLWHWLYFLPQAPHSQIGTDGHPRRGGFLPPVPLPRRMWAGSQLRWFTHNPLRLGQALERLSRVASVEHKQGRSGEMVFVKVEHTVRNLQGPALQEFHDIVYRHASPPGEPAPPGVPAETGAPWQREWLPDAVMLFRYSALTFNGHRIHYDRAYTMQEEGYPGLVVHGPLIATLLMELVREHAPERAVASFQFRAQRPTFDGRPLCVNGAPAPDGRSVRLWAQDADGFLTMSATAAFA
ncbi:MAG: MaoC family dehydratase N-terminal domain-containing protein [Acidovorax sp.]|uniref:FAS1-like dehydratase domain-containing protein n=1 Tax=Acidovorax sp. TaxID=1872122 RepID=UPI0022C20621|nr:MaoC family dehydratase N-terminal domain-containing protein [Acidovorax sp.]MCZ8218599.1 MaoC family dehydratase N-terminal domain-containing protein [Acidovorax sp.]